MSVKCAKCDSDNTDTAKFCSECASPLQPFGDIGVTKTIETPVEQLTSGDTLADRYEIIEELGRGGMGEVYLAEDTNLKRQVAIKVLPQEFALDKERLARFEREARLLASLNHPNIATIFGLEKSDGQQFLVMELVEGDTLAERIKKGVLQVDEALEVCRQIAEGLESAHEKGIIHRDLKPSNVKVTPEGKVKILDFGLAKAFQEEPIAADLSKSPTLTDQMTRPGAILGTAAYMSPEQARSRSVDKRTDIWAFGCVLYECLTGKPVLLGETVTDTLALILKGEPDWTKLPSNTPTMIRILLRRCLQKDPRRRLHDIADARIELEEIETTLPEEATITKRFPMNWILIFVAAGILFGFLIGIIANKIGRTSLSPSPVTSVIKLEPGHSFRKGARPTLTCMTISKDGSFIVYVAVNEEAESNVRPQLFLRELGKLDADPISGTEGGIAPFLSPDDRWVGFWRDGKLRKIPVEGGVPQDLCEAGLLLGASWSDDDTIVFTNHVNTGLFRVSSEGGKPEILTEPALEQREYSHRLPFHLPRGKGVLFTIMSNLFDVEPRIAILEGTNRKWRTLLEDASDARYISTGHLVFLRRGTLMAIAFDMQKLEVFGQPVPVIPGVMHGLNSNFSFTNTAAGQYNISDSGSLAYVPGGIIPNKKNILVWVDQKGNETKISSHTKAYFAPRLSPDGQKILYRTSGTEWYVWVYDIPRDIHRQVVAEGMANWPIWTQDGKTIVFPWTDSFPWNIYMVPADGSKEMERLTTSPSNQFPSSISPDGNLMACVVSIGGNHNILIYDFRDKSNTPIVAPKQRFPEFSPDGRWLAYCSSEEGQGEVYVCPSSGIGETIKVSREGGREPLWARSGKQLFFRSNNGRQIWAAEVQTEPSFSVGKPRLLFEKRGLSHSTPIRSYDISLDDQRFLMVRGEEGESQPVTEMILIQNWFEELKRLVPTGK